jgi:hypothetical protein
MKVYICGCCGDDFKGKKQDPKSNIGFGTCPSCEEWLQEKEYNMMTKSIELLASRFSEEKKTELLAMSRAAQEVFVHRAFADGVLIWSIR